MTQEKFNIDRLNEIAKSRSEEATKKAEERKKVRTKRIISQKDVDRHDYDDTDDKFCYNDYVNG